MIRRGEIWWADLGEPLGSEPGGRRPVVIIQSDGLNRSNLRTATVATFTTNVRWAAAPGNVLVPAWRSGLPRDSVINVTQITTVDREILAERVGCLDEAVMTALESGLRTVLGL